MDRSSVANHLRLLELSREIQEDVEVGRLSMGHAKALLQVSSPERRRHLRNRIVKEGSSVREAERLARAAGESAPRRNTQREAAVEQHQELSQQLQRQLQARVKIRGAASGRIEIDYFGQDDLQRITGMLLGDG